MHPTKLLFAFTVWFLIGHRECRAAPIFSPTTVPSAWQVALTVYHIPAFTIDTFAITFGMFPTSGFNTAVQLTIPSRTDWIANNTSGDNNSFFIPVLFVYRQSFDLTGFDPATAQLSFQWAADDSGQGFADRGTWKPQYSLNGGPRVTGLWLSDFSYNYGSTVTLSNGFVAGVNTLTFYVEGNAISDGFALRTVNGGLVVQPLAAAAVPEPATALVVLGFLGVSGLVARRRPRPA